MYRGLIKRYRKQEGNQTALKGSLQFSKHLALNLVHKERFYVKYTQYSTEHLLHEILFKTIQLLANTNTNSALKGRIASLAMNFPEMKDCKITASTFDQLVFDRKNKPYEKAIDIAKLLLLNYHPDVVKGRNNVLALMFDMNNLWEKFILVTLRKRLTTHQVFSQVSRNFWLPVAGSTSTLRPDIVIQHKTSEEFIVLDTKWKNINDSNPSSEDLRQMYVYHRFYQANTVLLIYPSDQHQIRKGNYFNSAIKGELSDKECSIIQIATCDTIQTWQEEIVRNIQIYLGV